MMKERIFKVRLLTIAIILVSIATLFTGPVMAQIPPIPHAFYGNITVNGEPAPIGTVVEGRCEGVTLGLQGNPIIISEVGKYGSENLGVKLVVQGDIEGNPTVSFYINGVKADQTYKWESGDVTQLNLTVTITSPEPPPPSGPPEQPITLQSIILGDTYNIPISSSGEIQETINISAELPKGRFEISIRAGTMARSQGGSRITSLTAEVESMPPPAPEDYTTIYMPVNLEPSGATFNPPIVITFHYNSSDIPDGIDENDLVLAFFDDSIEEWSILPSNVDSTNESISASVTHFTCFAILVPLVEIPGQETTPPPTPPAPGVPGEVSAPPSSQEKPPAGTTEPVEKPEPLLPPGPPVPPAPESGTNWALIGGIIAAVVVIAAGIIIFRRIRSSYY